MTSRNYCITVWEEVLELSDERIRYCILGEEVCPDTGRTHWQGYIELHNAVRGTALHKILGIEKDEIWFSPRRGTRDEARKYCMKDGKYEEYGKWIKGQGHRSDLEEVCNGLLRGDTRIEEVMMENPVLYCKYRNGLKDIAALGLINSIDEFRHVEVEVLIGPSGCGKTRSAVENNPGNYFMLNCHEEKLWFDGYQGEEVLILDDFYGTIRYGELLRILDGYKYRCAIKGGHTWAQWTKVIITSNDGPDKWYNRGVTPALARRIGDVTYMSRST